MKIFKMKYMLMLAALVTLAAACKKEHYTDGGVHRGKLDMNVYDFLKSRPFEFDTIVWILDKTGLAEEVKKDNITFFAPKDLCVVNFLNKRGGAKLDTLSAEVLKKAMSKYIFPNVKVWRDEVPFLNNTDGGGVYIKTILNDSMLVDSPLREDYNGVPQAGPKFIRLWDANGFARFRSRRFDAASTWPENKDTTTNPPKLYNPWVSSGSIITSDLQATNGVIQVLNGTHTFGFPFK
jgi:hypothetical protein